MSGTDLQHRSGRRSPERLSRILHRSESSLRRLRFSRRRAEQDRRNWRWIGAVVFASLLVISIAIWPWVRTHLQAVAILKILGGQPVPAIVTATVAAPITIEDIRFAIPDGGGGQQIVRAREYLPTGKKSAPALMVLHGVHHLGIDEPRLEAFARAISNCGVRVLTPELPDIKDYHVDQSSVRTIGELAKWFANQTGTQVGVVGLSFSGGLSLVAAAEPEYKDAFKFVLAVGAQDSMQRVTEYYRTGRDVRPNGSVEELKPHEYGPLVLEYEYVEDFVPAPDVPAIKTVLRAHLYEDKAAEVVTMAALTATQRVETTHLMDTQLEETQKLLSASDIRHAKELEELSPHGKLGGLTVPVYLMHGEADNIIPSAEMLWLAKELPPGALKAALVSPVISHIDFETSQPTVGDEWRLIDFFARVMGAAERKQ